MTRTRSALPLALALCLGLSACASIKVVHDSDPSADFASYRTWAWVSDENLIEPRSGISETSYVSPLDEQRIRRAVESSLASKGYRKAGRDEADLIASFTVGSEEKVGVYTTPSVGYYDPYYGDYGYGGWYGGSQVRSYQYTEGTLALEFYDRNTKNAVWVGWASKRVSRSDDSEKLLKQAIAKILESFPARP